MSLISFRLALAAAGAGGSNEYLLIDEYTSGSYAYNDYYNAVLRTDEGSITTVRKIRASNLSTAVWTEKFNPDLTFVAGSSNVSGNFNKNYTTYPILSSSNTYDWDGLFSQTNDNKYYRADDTTYGSANGLVRNFAINNLYSGTSWTSSKTKNHYIIGNRAFISRVSTNYGSSFGSYPHLATSGSNMLADLGAGWYDTYNNGGFADVLPVNPASSSTDHIVVHSSGYHTQMYKLDSSFNATGSGWRSTSGSDMNYFSNVAIDRSNNTIYAYTTDGSYLYVWNYSTNVRARHTITLPSGSPSYSGWMFYMNGYVYQYIYSQSGLYLLRYQTSNITGTEESYLLTVTSGTANQVGRQNGFMIEGANSALGDTDLFYLGFNNATSAGGGYRRNTLAHIKWDNIPTLATYNNNLTVTSSTVSIGSGSSIGSDTTNGSPNNGSLSNGSTSNPYNQNPFGSSSRQQYGSSSVTKL